MFRNRDFFDHFAAAVSATWTEFLFQGILLILLGITVAVFPQLLVAMVSVALIAAGILFVIIAMKTRKLRSRYYIWREEFWEPGL